jgi:hypothetical protein
MGRESSGGEFIHHLLNPVAIFWIRGDRNGLQRSPVCPPDEGSIKEEVAEAL